MKTHVGLLRGSRLILLPALVLIGGRSFAQQAPAPAVDARTLAKYDLNKNGRLDPDEIAAMQADDARAATATTGGGASGGNAAAGETVTLSPFEVREANN